MNKYKSMIKVYIEKFKEKLRRILNNEDDEKNTIHIISGVSEVGSEIYYHWAEEQRALPEEKPSDWFATQKAIYEQEEKSVPNAEREELIQRLKAMAEEEVLPQEQKEHRSGIVQKLLSSMEVGSAMCYEPAAPDMTYTFTCPRCGRIVKELDYDSRYELHKIASLVKKMKQLGYDVKTERVCSICSGRSGKHPLYVDTLFYFRFKGMEAYHVIVANHSQDYEVVLDFLRSKNSYYISEHKDIIEKMLGIKI